MTSQLQPPTGCILPYLKYSLLGSTLPHFHLGFLSACDSWNSKITDENSAAFGAETTGSGKSASQPPFQFLEGRDCLQPPFHSQCAQHSEEYAGTVSK